MDQNQAELVHRVLQIISQADKRSLENTLAVGEAADQLKVSEAWRGFYPLSQYPKGRESWRGFIILSGKKPQTVENARRIVKRWGPQIKQSISEGYIPIPTRLVKCLTLKPEALSDRDIILTLCDSNIPHDAFISGMKQLKGKPDTVCDHINVTENKREQWIKHTCCGTWEQIS